MTAPPLPTPRLHGIRVLNFPLAPSPVSTPRRLDAANALAADPELPTNHHAERPVVPVHPVNGRYVNAPSVRDLSGSTPFRQIRLKAVVHGRPPESARPPTQQSGSENLDAQSVLTYHSTSRL